jgi:hypothetical protein
LGFEERWKICGRGWEKENEGVAKRGVVRGKKRFSGLLFQGQRGGGGDLCLQKTNPKWELRLLY